MRIMETAEGVTIDLDNEEETGDLARALAALAVPGTVIGLIGPLGAGKTRFTKSFAEAMGVDPDAVSSPTFVLIHEYEGVLPIFHFDAYRLGGPEPFEALGAAEYWEAGGVCLVEWADLVADSLPSGSWWLMFVPTGEHQRRVFSRGVNAACLRKALRESHTAFDRGEGQF